MNREEISREISIMEVLLTLIELDSVNFKKTHPFGEGNQKTPHFGETYTYLKLAEPKLFHSLLGLYRKNLYLEDLDSYLFRYSDPQIHISSQLSVFLSEVGLSMNGSVNGITIGFEDAKRVMIYLRRIKRFFNMYGKFIKHKENLESLKNTEFYKYLECNENSDPLDTILDFYINELNFKLLNPSWKLRRATEGISDENSSNLATDYDKYFDSNGEYKYSYSNSEDKKCLKESTDTSLPEDKIESTSNFNTTESNFNTTEGIIIKPDLMEFLSSIGIDLPSANIDEGMASIIKDFLECNVVIYNEYLGYIKFHLRTILTSDYISITEKLSFRIDKTSYYLEELNKSIKSSE